MKFLTLLLCIYMLILPCLPCGDMDECSDPEQSSIAQTGDHQQNDEEACGPFCACFCCGHIFSSNFQMPKIAVTKPQARERLQCFYNNVSLPSDFFGNIWQPPKFS